METLPIQPTRLPGSLPSTRISSTPWMSRGSIAISAVIVSFCLHQLTEFGFEPLQICSSNWQAFLDFLQGIWEGAKDFETLELSMIAFIVLLFYFLIYSIWVFEVKSCPMPCLSSTFAQRVSLNEYE